MAKTPNYNWTTYEDGITVINFQTDISNFIKGVDTKLKQIETDIVLSHSRQPLTMTSHGTQASLDAKLNNCVAEYGSNTRYRFEVSTGAGLSLHGGTWSIEGEGASSSYEWQTARKYGEEGHYRMRSKNNGVWSEWQNIANDADVANLKNRMTTAETNIGLLAWEPYTNLELLAGWSGTMRFRKCPALRILEISSYGLYCGTTSAGTVPAWLPPGLRPVETSPILVRAQGGNRCGGFLMCGSSGDIMVTADGAERLSTGIGVMFSAYLQYW